MRLRGTTTQRRLGDGRAEQVGFCRFFRNRKVTVPEIVATAAARTGAAAAGRHVLLIEDTSEINYQAKAGRKRELGRVGNGTDIGLFVHPALALDAADGTALGLAGATIWRRSTAKQRDYQSQPIETKESYRWLETITQARAPLAAARLVTVVADREADIYELFARLPDARTHLVVRAAQDRALGDGGCLFAELAAQPPAGCLALALPARARRPARTARLVVRHAAVSLRQPARGADPRDAAAVPVNVVELREIDPPNSKDAVLWRLLTTHPVDGLAEALDVAAIYQQRWAIEQLFRTVKSQAFDLEASLLADGAALERLAAATLVAATTVTQLVHARDQAGGALPAARAFGPEQIATLLALTPRLEGRTAKQKNPYPPQSLAWAAWLIARLGGWTGYSSERPPGPVTFTNGLQRFEAISEGFNLAQRQIP
jgi:IS4 transposase